MDTAIIILIILQVILILLVIGQFLYSISSHRGKYSGGKALTELRMMQGQLSAIQKQQAQEISQLRTELSQSIREQMQTVQETLQRQNEADAKARAGAAGELNNNMTVRFRDMNDSVTSALSSINHSTASQLRQLEERFRTLESTTEQKLSDIRQTISGQLVQMKEDNNRLLGKMTEDNHKQLDLIRGTVDEKLQEALDKKLTQSFQLVSERLEQVYKGLGEMQTIAQGVGDLKNVLSNVKTRGILGEIQLGAILDQILAPGQYAENVATVPHSAERVEFAVILPGAEEGSQVYLPIDSKFNGDLYARLQQTYENGSKDEIAAVKKELFQAIRKNAKDIRDKYIYPPATTQFGIMFLPFEGLYAEVVNSELVTILQRDYQVNIAGPSTMAAMLNSLQMGFRTLAIQKRSDEVWKILGSVKTEFDTFADALEKTQKHIQSVEKDLDNLIGVRTRQITRKLNQVSQRDTESLPI